MNTPRQELEARVAQAVTQLFRPAPSAPYVRPCPDSRHGDFQTNTALVQAKEATEVLVCLSCESREEVDDLVAKAVAAGGRAPRPPQDHGFMYGHGFEDLDGHIWELAWMAPQG